MFQWKDRIYNQWYLDGNQCKIIFMVYDKIIRGKFITLRSIEEDDAEFSYAIRSAEGNRETVGQLAPSIEAQREYIARQREKDGDYYFVILN